MAFLARITIWVVYGKCFAKLTGPCVTLVATGREREEDSRGMKQNLKIACVTFDMSSEHSSAAPPGTVVPGVHELPCSAQPGGQCLALLRGYSVSKGLVLCQWHHLTPCYPSDCWSQLREHVPAEKSHSPAVPDKQPALLTLVPRHSFKQNPLRSSGTWCAVNAMKIWFLTGAHSFLWLGAAMAEDDAFSVPLQSREKVSEKLQVNFRI